MEWQTLVGGLLNVESLDQVRNKIEDMRKEELRLKDEAGNLSLELNSFKRYRRIRINDLFSAIKVASPSNTLESIAFNRMINNCKLARCNVALTEQLNNLKESSRGKSELEDRVRKLERKLNVVQKDRDHYRTINEMFEREMTHVGGNSFIHFHYLFNYFFTEKLKHLKH